MKGNSHSKQVKTIFAPTAFKTRNGAQSTSEKARETLALAKDTAQSAYHQAQEGMHVRWDKARAWLAMSIGIIAALVQKNKNQAQKNLEKVQANLQEMQDVLQMNVGSRLQRISESTSRARQNVTQAALRAQEMRTFWQEQMAERKRQRRRTRMLFLSGLIIGATLALLYAPLAGPETYQRMVRYLRQYRFAAQ